MAGKLQFFRSFVAEFGDVKIDGTAGDDSTLRVRFMVERDRLPWPNGAELEVFNLSRDSRAKLSKAGPVVARILAGYDGEPSQIFYGRLENVEHIKEGTDWRTRMSASDCGREIAESRVTVSFAKGVLVRDVIKEILKSLDLGEGNLSAFANDSDMLRPLGYGLALHGNLVEELTHFLRSAALEFSIQDGKVQFVKIGRGAPNTKGPLLSPSTGLVGSPRLVREKARGLCEDGRKKKPMGTVREALEGGTDDSMIMTVEATCLLNPSVVPGVPFRVESEHINGDFVCVAMRHTGDSRGADWHTELKGIPLRDFAAQ